MKKLEDIRTKCQEAIDDYADLVDQGFTFADVERGRAELAEEVLEILNGVKE